MSILKDGFPTTVALAGLVFHAKEKMVTPPGLDMGGPIDVSTMYNEIMRTRWHKSLVTVTPLKLTIAYDVSIYGDFMEDSTGGGVNALITVTFADGRGVRFWGFVDKIEPNEDKEGEQPTATMTIEATNLNNSDVEVEPVPF